MAEEQQNHVVLRKAATKAGVLPELATTLHHWPPLPGWRVQHGADCALFGKRLHSVPKHFEGAVVSYRLKRMTSILRKLQRRNVTLSWNCARRYRQGAASSWGDSESSREAAKIMMIFLNIASKRLHKLCHMTGGYRSYHVICKVPVEVRTALRCEFVRASNIFGQQV